MTADPKPPASRADHLEKLWDAAQSVVLDGVAYKTKGIDHCSRPFVPEPAGFPVLRELLKAWRANTVGSPGFREDISRAADELEKALGPWAHAPEITDPMICNPARRIIRFDPPYFIEARRTYAVMTFPDDPERAELWEVKRCSPDSDDWEWHVEARRGR